MIAGESISLLSSFQFLTGAWVIYREVMKPPLFSPPALTTVYGVNLLRRSLVNLTALLGKTADINHNADNGLRLVRRNGRKGPSSNSTWKRNVSALNYWLSDVF